MLFFKVLIAVGIIGILLVAAILLKCGISGTTHRMEISWEELSVIFQQGRKVQSAVRSKLYPLLLELQTNWIVKFHQDFCWDELLLCWWLSLMGESQVVFWNMNWV